MSIYEAHLGSWRRKDGEFMNYRELAHAIADYLSDLGFTHVELMPITEHPFYGSWGYQTTGYFAPYRALRHPAGFDVLRRSPASARHRRHSRLGTLAFSERCHGLAYFDGTHLYEHSDPRQGFHPEWNSAIFNYGRNEVRSFLISSAAFWFEKYHIDGIRVDAVASMLYLDYARKAGEWIPNQYRRTRESRGHQFSANPERSHLPGLSLALP
jgi:1,4-alpha-glucan branching enzyme